ncbi:hypothetical protein Btru_066793 [Bulinus truncatus]|nr:hypothetical protein Btru_066793 [Bulinus truncatus]
MHAAVYFELQGLLHYFFDPIKQTKKNISITGAELFLNLHHVCERNSHGDTMKVEDSQEIIILIKKNKRIMERLLIPLLVSLNILSGNSQFQFEYSESVCQRSWFNRLIWTQTTKQPVEVLRDNILKGKPVKAVIMAGKYKETFTLDNLNMNGLVICGEPGLPPSWFVTLLACHPPGLSPSWLVNLLVCHPPGLSPSWFVSFWLVTLLACHPPGLSPSWLVTLLVCHPPGLSPSGLSPSLCVTLLAFHPPGLSPSGLSPSWLVTLLACHPPGLSPSWLVTLLACHPPGLSPSWFVTLLVCLLLACHPPGLSPSWLVTLLACHPPGLSPSGLSPSWLVTLLVCHPPGLSPSWLVTLLACHPPVLPPSWFVTLLACHPPGLPPSWLVTLLACHPPGLSPSWFATLLACHPPGLPPSWLVTLLVCHPPGLSPSWLVTLLVCHPPALPPSWLVALLVCHPPGLSPSWLVTLLACHPPGLSTSLCVTLLVCHPPGLSPSWFVTLLVCHPPCVSPSWFVTLLVCHPPCVSPSWFVTLLVCHPPGLSPSWFATLLACRPPGLPPYWIVTLLACHPPGLSPSWLVTHLVCHPPCLSPSWCVTLLVCHPPCVSPSWFVTLLVCHPPCVSPSWFVTLLVCHPPCVSPSWFVTLLVCHPPGLSRSWFVTLLVCHPPGLSPSWFVTLLSLERMSHPIGPEVEYQPIIVCTNGYVSYLNVSVVSWNGNVQSKEWKVDSIIFSTRDYSPEHIPVTSRYLDGSSSNGFRDNFLAMAEKSEMRGVMKDRGYAFTMENTHADYATKHISAQSLSHVSQSYTDTGGIVFREQPYHWLSSWETTGRRDSARWTMGNMKPLKHTNDFVALQWFSDSCWTIVYEHDKNGNPIQGSFEMLKTFVKMGYRVRVNFDGYTLEANSVLVAPDDVIVAQTSAEMARRGGSDVDKTFFNTKTRQVYRLVHTTGVVRSHLYFIENGQLSAKSTENFQITWSVDTRPWSPVVRMDSKNNVTSGNVTSLIYAMDTSSIRVKVEIKESTINGNKSEMFLEMTSVRCPSSSDSVPEIVGQSLRTVPFYRLGTSKDYHMYLKDNVKQYIQVSTASGLTIAQFDMVTRDYVKQNNWLVEGITWYKDERLYHLI